MAGGTSLEAVFHWFTVADTADCHVWTLPLKDRPTSTATSTIKDETNSTILPLKDETIIPQVFLSSTVPAKDQTTTASISLKDQFSIITVSAKDETTISQMFVSSSVAAKDRIPSSTVPVKDQTSTSTVWSKDETTASAVFSSTTLLTKDQTTSSTIAYKDQTSTFILPAKDATTTSSVISSSTASKEPVTSTSMPSKDQISTPTPPVEDETTTTSECSSTTLLVKGQTTSSWVPIKDQTSTSAVPTKDQTKMSFRMISSTTMPAKDETKSPTVPLKDQKGSSSIASRNITGIILTTTASSSTCLTTSTSVSLKEQTITSSSAAEDEMITSAATTRLPSRDMTVPTLTPFKDQKTISLLPAGNATIASPIVQTFTIMPTEDESSSLPVPNKILNTATSALPTRAEQGATAPLISSMGVFKNPSITARKSATNLSTYSVTIFPSTTSVETLKGSGLSAKDENSTLSGLYRLSTGASIQSYTTTIALSSQKDETITVFSSSLPAKYFPSFMVSSSTSLPAKDVFTSATPISTIPSAAAPGLATGVSAKLPVASTAAAPVDYTLGLLPLSSTGPNVMGILPGLSSTSTVAAPAVSTLGVLPLSSMSFSGMKEVPPVSGLSTISALAAPTLGLDSLPTSDITPITVLTVPKSSAAFTGATQSPSTISNTTSTFRMLVSVPETSNSIASSITVLPSLEKSPVSTSSSVPTSVFGPSSLAKLNISILPSVVPSSSPLRAFNPALPANSTLSLIYIAPQSFSMIDSHSVPAFTVPTDSKLGSSPLDLTVTGIPISDSNGSSTMIPMYTPGLLGNAYGGGYITTPTIYIVVSSTPTIGVPPGYGFSLSPEGTTIILSIPTSSTSFSSPERTSTLPEAPKSTEFDVPGIAQAPATSTSGNGSFLAPLQPSSLTTFQGAASKYSVVLLTLLLGLLVVILIH
ncbi:hypothetical protein MMC18_004530 [Xylographa bjoerkii]|nr:hypothetical protein [Xylographa bjoerkii]